MVSIVREYPNNCRLSTRIASIARTIRKNPIIANDILRLSELASIRELWTGAEGFIPVGSLTFTPPITFAAGEAVGNPAAARALAGIGVGDGILGTLTVPSALYGLPNS